MIDHCPLCNYPITMPFPAAELFFHLMAMHSCFAPEFHIEKLALNRAQMVAPVNGKIGMSISADATVKTAWVGCPCGSKFGARPEDLPHDNPPKDHPYCWAVMHLEEIDRQEGIDAHFALAKLRDRLPDESVDHVYRDVTKIVTGREVGIAIRGFEALGDVGCHTSMYHLPIVQENIGRMARALGRSY